MVVVAVVVEVVVVEVVAVVVETPTTWFRKKVNSSLMRLDLRLNAHQTDTVLLGHALYAPNLCNITKSRICYEEEGGSVFFYDALNTFYLRLYGVGHMVARERKPAAATSWATLFD